MGRCAPLMTSLFALAGALTVVGETMRKILPLGAALGMLQSVATIVLLLVMLFFSQIKIAVFRLC